jgi:phage shock protein PspC (stress-responsive transcriptional regulator)
MDETNETLRLVRRKNRRILAGVAGGIGDHFGVSPAWIRLAFVLTTFLGGMGVAAYVLLWFLVPREDLPRSAAQQVADRFPDAPAWIGIVLIAIGVLSLTSRIGEALGIHLGSLAWALLLIGGGLALFRRGEDLERPAQASAAVPAMGTAGSAARGTAVTEPLPAMPVVPAPRPPRERSPLGWLTLGLALAASGLVAVLREAGTVHLTLAQALAVPLTIIGAGLLVGTVIGRSRWTVLLGLLLAPVVVAASAFTVPVNGIYGDISVSRATQVRSSYVLSGGGLSLDLSRLDPERLPSTIDVRIGAGSVDVTLPKHGVRVDATVNVGDIHMRRSVGGLDVANSMGDQNATTVVKVHVDVGEVRAWYGSAAPAKAKGGSK